MKRSQIHRRTPMPRGTKGLARGKCQLKRTKLSPVSKKKRAFDAKNKPQLDKYRRQHPRCECGEPSCGLDGEQIHEIAAGSHRLACRGSVACVLHLAAEHHERCQGEPYVKGLGRKLFSSPETFDLHEFLRRIGRAETAITIDEVVAAMPQKPKAAEDLRLTYEHWTRKVALLTKQLNEAYAKQTKVGMELFKAEARERAVRRAE